MTFLLSLTALAALSVAKAAPLERLAAVIAADVMKERPEPPLALCVKGEGKQRPLTALLLADFASAKLSPLPLEPSLEEARKAGARSLFVLTLRVENGALVAQGELQSTWVNFWAGRAKPSPVKRFSHSLEADAQTLALLKDGEPNPLAKPGQSPPLRLSSVRLTLLPVRTAALAAGDLDGDGRKELIALTSTELLALDASGKVLARRSVEGLPRAKAAVREPFGSIAILSGPPRLAYFLAGKEEGEELRWDVSAQTLSGERTLAAPVFGEGDALFLAKPVPGKAFFESRSDSLQLSAVAVHREKALLRSLRVFMDGTARLSLTPSSSRTDVRFTSLGAASTLADLDGDGQPELVSTSAETSPTPEKVRVLELTGQERAGTMALELAGRALQAVAMDVNADGHEEVVLGVWLPDGTTELRVLYGSAP